MDFFKYYSVASLFADALWLRLVICAVGFVAVFVFQAIALFTIAKRNGYKNKWMAFLPFFNTYYIGVCAQKNSFYRINAKTIGLIATIAEVVLFVSEVLYFAAYAFVLPYEAETESAFMGIMFKSYALIDVPEKLAWAAWVYVYLERYVIRIMRMLFLVLQIALLTCFFQTYASNRYVIFTVTSVILPVQGILFFVVRNNRGVNYRDYIRAREYARYQQYQQQYHQQNFDGNYQQPFNQNPYRSNDSSPYEETRRNENPSSAPDDPFEEFSGKGSDSNPFDDFSSN